MAPTPDRPAGDMKDRFRKALERKRSQQSDAQSDAEALDPSKIHGAHGVARTQRTFRRKSGD
ncbi:MAG: DUF5302 domain-containing protein [Actinomycetota bacterium]